MVYKCKPAGFPSRARGYEESAIRRIFSLLKNSKPSDEIIALFATNPWVYFWSRSSSGMPGSLLEIVLVDFNLKANVFLLFVAKVV